MLVDSDLLSSNEIKQLRDMRKISSYDVCKACVEGGAEVPVAKCSYKYSTEKATKGNDKEE